MSKNGYENDDDELTTHEKRMPLYVSWASWILVALCLLYMYKFTDNRSNRGQIEFGFYLVDAIVYFLMGLYFYFLFVRLNYHNRNAMELKIISIFAGIATLAKCVLVIINDLIPHLANIWSDAYYCVEALLWALLSVFFFLYARRMYEYDFDGEFNDDYLDD